MPTLTRVESFQHRVLATAPVASGQSAMYDDVTRGGTLPNHGSTGVTFDTGVKRTSKHANSLKIVMDGVTQTHARRACATTMVVGSYYFRIDAAPSASSKMFAMAGAGGTISIGMDTTGHVTAKCGAGTQQTSSGTYHDAAWHRVDFKADTSGATATLDVQVDGTAITQSSVAVASANITNFMVGSNTAADTLTVYFQDLVISETSADYPLGDHICLKLEIAGTGTHSQGAGAFQDEAGNTTDAELLNSIDDAWDGTTPELSQTGEDFVAQTANDVNGYVEFTIAAVPANTVTSVWGATPTFLMAALDATTANLGRGKLVDSAGTTLADTNSVDPSLISTGYSGERGQLTAAPSGGWSETTLEACKLRVGFSGDAAPDFIVNSAIVEYAGVEDVGGGGGATHPGWQSGPGGWW